MRRIFLIVSLFLIVILLAQKSFFDFEQFLQGLVYKEIKFVWIFKKFMYSQPKIKIFNNINSLYTTPCIYVTSIIYWLQMTTVWYLRWSLKANTIGVLQLKFGLITFCVLFCWGYTKIVRRLTVFHWRSHDTNLPVLDKEALLCVNLIFSLDPFVVSMP